MNKIQRVKPYIPEEDKLTIVRCWEDILDKGAFVEGAYVKDFEQLISEYCGTKFAIATSTGATALEVALRASCIFDRKIIVPTQTFVASVSAIIRSGNIPVIADIDPVSQCLTIDSITPFIDEYVGGIMLVHMAGQITPDYHLIKALCKQKGWLLFEDASHAMGASIDGIKAGNLGIAGCFSLFSTKIITTGEGGVITTNDETFAEKCRIIKNHGCVRNKGKWPKLDYGVNCVIESSNYRMPEFAAVLGITQAKRIDEFVERRNVLANRYHDKIKNPKVELPYIPDNIRMTWWQYIITLKDEVTTSREQICACLSDHYQIPTANAYWPPCHKQPAFLAYTYRYDYPVADKLLERHIALPMHVELEEEQVDFIAKIVNTVI